MLIDFESDPAADHAQLSRLQNHQRQNIAGWCLHTLTKMTSNCIIALALLFLAGEAIVKSYALPGSDGKPFLAYMLPKGVNADEDVDPDIARLSTPRYPRLRCILHLL